MRFVLLRSFSLLLPILLAACAPLPAEQKLTTNEETYRVAEHTDPEADRLVSAQIDLVSRRTRAVCVTPEFQSYFQHTPCLPSGMTDKHLSDKRLPTAEELRAAKRVFAQIDEMNHETLAVMQKTQDTRYTELAEKIRYFYTPKIERLQNELLTGRLPWNAYNARRKALNLSLIHI